MDIYNICDWLSEDLLRKHEDETDEYCRELGLFDECCSHCGGEMSEKLLDDEYHLRCVDCS